MAGWQESFKPESNWQASFKADAEPYDVAKSYVGGLERGAAATAMLLPNLLNSAAEGPQLLYRGLTGREHDNSPTYKPFYSSEDALKMLPESLQPHEPTTTGGQIANIAGDLLGSFAAGTSPKSLMINRNQETEPVRLAKILTEKKVPTYLTDVLPENSAYKGIADVLGDVPLGRNSSKEALQQSSLNKALSKEMGMDSNTVNPPLMAKSQKETGDVFKYVGDNYNIAKADTNTLINNLATTQGKIQGLDPKSANPLNYYINDILDKVGANGEIPGVSYMQTRADLGRLARTTTDPAVEQGAYKIQKMLDKAISPSIPGDMQKVFSENRGFYRNTLALEPTVTKNVRSGDVDPASLQQGVSKIFPKYEYDDKSSLAQLTQGAQLLRPSLQAGASTPMQRFAKQYGLPGNAAQVGLMGSFPFTAPLGRMMNPKLKIEDFSPDMQKALVRALSSSGASLLPQSSSGD